MQPFGKWGGQPAQRNWDLAYYSMKTIQIALNHCQLAVNSLADAGVGGRAGGAVTHPLSWSNFFHFRLVFEKKLGCLLGSQTRLANRGSVTGMGH